MFRVFCVFCFVFAFSSILVSANETLETLKAEPETQEEDILEHEGLVNPYSSVNISEEYGFDSRQNVDSFLGDVYNPAKPLPSNNTYKGSRSEIRNDRDIRDTE